MMDKRWRNLIIIFIIIIVVAVVYLNMDKLPVFAQDDLSPIAAKYSFNLDTLDFEKELSREDLGDLKMELSKLSQEGMNKIAFEKVSLSIDVYDYLVGFYTVADFIAYNDDACGAQESILSVKDNGLNILDKIANYNYLLIEEHSEKKYVLFDPEGVQATLDSLDGYGSLIENACA
jgi:hypothetical protein